MKSVKRIIILISALLISAAILCADIIFSFPREITMYRGQINSGRINSAITIGTNENMPVSSSSEGITPLKEGQYSASLTVAGKIPIKKVKINVTNPRTLCASGELIGLRIHNNGLIVVDTASVETDGGTVVSPAGSAGIRKGDVILKLNGISPESSGDVSHIIKGDAVTVTYLRNNQINTVTVTPECDKKDNTLKLGIWVRDSTAGVGTMTYYDPETLSFGSLGHSISDTDTGVLFNILKGTVEKSNVVSVKKGEKGSPGEICGAFSSGEISGTLLKNCESGVFGTLSSDCNISGTLFPVALINEVKKGKACILSTVDDSIKKYDIEIVRTMPFGAAAKGLSIRITDNELLSKTGGIIQGMSGSPIIQDGKLVGAVTHVLINDPTRGYGIYIERMLSE